MQQGGPTKRDQGNLDTFYFIQGALRTFQNPDPNKINAIRKIDMPEYSEIVVFIP